MDFGLNLNEKIYQTLWTTADNTGGTLKVDYAINTSTFNWQGNWSVPLGKYEYIIGALKQPFQPDNFIVLAIFGIGCIFGIAAFSRLISVMLDRFENATMAVLTGIMCGSMRKIWPWKETLETVTINGKEKILSEANVLPAAIDAEFWAAVALAAVGFIAVLLMERTAEGKE